MPFPQRGAAASVAAPGIPPVAPPAPAGPPTPAPAPASALKLWVSLNGASVLKTEAECRVLPATTPAMSENQTSGWLTIAAFLPASTPAAQVPVSPPAGGRASFGSRAPAVAPPIAAPTHVGGVPATLFSGVEGAEVFRKGNNVESGNYIAKLCSAEYKTGRTASYVILEVEILVSTYSPDAPDTINCNREGSRATIFVKQNDSFASNIKEAILALSGFNEANQPRPEDDVVNQDECNALIDARQAFKGAIVYLEAREITTKKGTPFTRICWWPCPLAADGTPDQERLHREVR